MWCAPIRHISGCRKFCNRRFFGQNRRFLGLRALESKPHGFYGQKKFGGGFGPSLLPKKILGCGAHPETHFRPPENSVVGVFLGENRDFYKFLPMSSKYQGGSPRYLTGWGRHIDPNKPFAPQKVCVHTRHTLSETSKKSFFWSTKRQHFDEKIFVCALWVQILVWSAPNCFSRKVWSEKIVLHTLDTFH